MPMPSKEMNTVGPRGSSWWFFENGTAFCILCCGVSRVQSYPCGPCLWQVKLHFKLLKSESVSKLLAELQVHIRFFVPCQDEDDEGCQCFSPGLLASCLGEELMEATKKSAWIAGVWQNGEHGWNDGGLGWHRPIPGIVWHHFVVGKKQPCLVGSWQCRSQTCKR